MAALEPPFIDTSILVSGLIEMGDASAASRTILEAVVAGRLKGVHTAWHCCLEFYAVATRLPAGLRMSPTLARQLLNENVFGKITIVDLPAAARRPLLDTAVAEHVTGGRVYDAHIAETARAAGAKIVVTDNRRHFVGLMRYGIRVLTAAEFVDEYGL